ncbi:DUF6197 family protein [Streptomyces sp. 4N509B]|uniref:DUF6197 family protein n=1 Tax=Streptomyces sp. 4N509B TaxID=3457413 RepID=UPI003FD59399
MPTLVAIGDIQISERDLAQLINGVEQYLADAAPTPRGTGVALPPVDELIRQAGIQTGPAPRARRRTSRTPDVDLPGRLRSMLPMRRRAARQVSVARHLELTLDVLERYGWARTGTGTATLTGRRCILGAQHVLLALGIGDEDTINRAGDYLDTRLRKRGITNPYHQWNESPGRSWDDVKYLLTTTITDARKAA